MDGVVTMQLFILFILIALTAYFVMVEFAIVKVRSSRIEQLVSEGNKKAIKAKLILNDLDGYLSACQLGITVTALGLGWLGEGTVQSILSPLINGIVYSEQVSTLISFALSFFLVTYVNVVFGELAPKSIAIQKAEKITLNFASSLILFYKITYPCIWLLNGSSNAILKVFGMSTANGHADVHTEEEIKMIVSNSNEINNDEKILVEKIFDFDEKLTRDLMVHRMDMDCVSIDSDISELLEEIKQVRHSRLIVIGEGKDDVRGYVNIRDIYKAANENLKMEDIVRKIPSVYAVTPAKRVLKKLQQERVQLAIVLDEYSGVAGLISMEDILEVLVGDIQDEYDDEEAPIREWENKWLVLGDTPIEDVEKELKVSFVEDNRAVSIAGYLMSYFDSIEEKGIYEIEGREFEVVKMNDHKIELIGLKK